MFRHRPLLLCGFTLIAFQIAAAQQAPPQPPPATQQQPPAGVAPQAAEPPRVAQPAAPQTPAGPQVTFNSVYVDQPYIAMTFDDGPHATLTPKLLDMLAARKLKATFFVIGQNAVEYPDIMKRIVREGHELANHSWSHPNLGKMGDDGVRTQLQKTDEAIEAAAGKRTTLMRPPYGSITPRQKQWMYETFGYKTIIWDVDPFDWRRPGPGVIRDRIVNQTQPGSIILAHDIHPGTIEAMPDTFDQLTAKGFKFATVSELLAMAKPGARPTATPKATATRAPGAASDPQPAATAAGTARPAASPASGTRPPTAPATAPRGNSSPAMPASGPAATPNG
ncbi:MAG: Peptidoglycan N-acetylglucosamine deacetylase [uncultured Chthoniobacterales bacterium]|uniref:Peptidoglycan N-acetylglucosamine deacetylase n=1 Tax=uncultured Chthoniobacterales bacterium TaxID=1836801 RepID=A0A6J4HYS9_9BACT|nr:MAG: Peptidoglycan N-acetylglucosamine deacetylase [uncultured Chthoniobacterales bacterium]